MYVDRDLEQRNLPLHTSFWVHGLGLNRHKIEFLYFDSLAFSASKAKYFLMCTYGKDHFWLNPLKMLLHVQHVYCLELDM